MGNITVAIRPLVDHLSTSGSMLMDVQAQLQHMFGLPIHCVNVGVSIALTSHAKRHEQGAHKLGVHSNPGQQLSAQAV